MTELLNLPNKTEKTYESITDVSALMKMVLPIESKIFMKSFTFKTTKSTDSMHLQYKIKLNRFRSNSKRR